MVFPPSTGSAYGGIGAVSPAGGGFPCGGKTVVTRDGSRVLRLWDIAKIMAQMYYSYILKSGRDNHLYIGMTSNLRKRVDEHNRGKVRSTKSRRPLCLVYYEEYGDKTSARKREIFLKSGQGRLFLKAKLEETKTENRRGTEAI